jgi:hypothetical protein
MARDPLTFRQRDVTAAIKAVKAAGYSVARIEIDRDGKIVIVPAIASGGEPVADKPDSNEWDEVFDEGSTEIR